MKPIQTRTWLAAVLAACSFAATAAPAGTPAANNGS